MMPRARSFARLLAALSLMVSWTGGGWAAACARGAVPPASAASAMPMEAMHAMAHHRMHGGMHHPAPPPNPHPSRPSPSAPKPDRPAPRGEMPACPLLVMNGGSCLGAAQLPSVAALPASPLTDVDGYPPADAIHDRLLPLSLFRPPEA